MVDLTELLFNAMKKHRHQTITFSEAAAILPTTTKPLALELAFHALNQRADVQLIRGVGKTAHYKYVPVSPRHPDDTEMVIAPTSGHNKRLSQALKYVVWASETPLPQVEARFRAEAHAGFYLKNTAHWGAVSRLARFGFQGVGCGYDDSRKELYKKLDDSSSNPQQRITSVPALNLTAPNGHLLVITLPDGSVMKLDSLTIEVVVKE